MNSDVKAPAGSRVGNRLDSNGAGAARFKCRTPAVFVWVNADADYALIASYFRN